MTTTATVRDFRGLASAEIDLSGITLIAGPNAAGKTSIVQAIAAAATGVTVPLDDLRKADAGAMIRTGSAKGTVTLTGPEGQASVTWPQAKLTTEGQPPTASAFASGLTDLLDEKPADRVLTLQRYLRALPSREDLAKALDGFPDDVIGRLWERIEQNTTDQIDGWAVCHSEAREKGARFKGQWEQATGERRHGEAKAASWTPDGWEEDLARCSQDSLEEAVTREREYLEGQVATAAISAEERRHLEEIAGQRAERSQAADAVAATLAKAREDLQEAEAARQALPVDQQQDGLACPHCGEAVAVEVFAGAATKLAKAEAPPTEDELKKRRLDIAAADGTVSRLRGEVSKAERELTEARAQVNTAIDCDHRLAKLGEAAPGDPAELERARERVRSAERRLAAFRVWAEATRLHRAVQDNARVVAVLAPDGLRQAKIAEATVAFGRSVSALCGVAGWAEVEFEEGVQPLYGGRPYGLLSESEKYRVRVAVQVALADLDGSALLLIDGADILDRDGRNGLFKALRSRGKPALVAMTITDPAKSPPPDLAAAGIGQTYWIENGTAAPLGGAGKVAA